MLVGMNLLYPLILIVAAIGLTAWVVLSGRSRSRRLAPWKSIRNGMTQQEVRGLLGEPRKVIPLDAGETWDYGAKPYTASVMFTGGKVTGFVKPF